MATVLVTGANRGIGLALTRHYAGRGDRVVATCRNPDRAADLRAVPGAVEVEAMDVADHATVDALAARLDGEPIDLLINNAGIYGGSGQRVGEMDYDAWSEAFRVNAMGPMKVSESLLDNLAAARRPVIACITSHMGSIARGGSGYVAYRSSKAALNMVGKILAGDLAGRGIVVVLVHPGWVQTEMGGRSAPLAPESSARDLAELFDRVGPGDSGRFFDHTGDSMPW